MESEFASWKNQYIDLIETKPGYITRLRTPEDNQRVKALIQERAAGREIVCELGCGSGGHLVELAARDVGRFFVGFELRFKRVFRSAEKGELLKLNNFLILQGDARKLSELFLPDSLDGVYVNFPDPWEKARWRKHRLLNSQNIHMIFTALKNGRMLRYKSDHKDYFLETAALLQGMPGVEVLSCTQDLYSSAAIAGNIASEFERLFRAQGLPIYYLEAKKLDGFHS